MSAAIDRTLVGGLESRLVNAWPAFEVELAEGWLMRFAEGYSKRANAASPILPGARLDEELIAQVLRAFAERGIPACFRLTGIEDDGADALLADEGFVEYDPSLGMVALIDALADPDPSVRIEPVAKPAWIAAAAAAQSVDKQDTTKLGRIVRSIRQPAGFATLVLDGQAAAWGFAVVERGFVGLYDIVVASDLRGLGLGRTLVSGLMGWGQRRGAERAYLQMREANQVADALYRSLGFTTAYRYTHRVLPDDERVESVPPPAA